VRAAARRLGIHKDTAFRWRHRVLAALGGATDPPPAGLVLVHETWLPRSEKGRRVTGRPARRRGLPAGHQYRTGEPLAWVIIAADGTGAVAGGVAGLAVGAARPGAAVVANRLLPLLGRPCRLAGGPGPLGAYGVACVRARIRYRRVRRPVRSEDRARAFRLWLRRFRGVATRYLERYVRWHVAVTVGRMAAAAADHRDRKIPRASRPAPQGVDNDLRGPCAFRMSIHPASEA